MEAFPFFLLYFHQDYFTCLTPVLHSHIFISAEYYFDHEHEYHTLTRVIKCSLHPVLSIDILMTKMKGGRTPHESKNTHLSSQTECRSRANNGRTKRNTAAVL